MRSDVRTVLFAGDWHGNAGWAAHCVGLADLAQADVVVQLGDFGIWPTHGGAQYLDLLEIMLADVDLALYFIDGNHEDFPQLYGYPLQDDGTRQVRPHIRHLPRGHRWSWSGLDFLALGGATSLDRGSRREDISWWPQEEITTGDAERALVGGHVDVMLTHDCPAGVAIPGINPVTDLYWPPQEIARARTHRELLGSVVDQVKPDRLLHGHFHVPYEAQRGPTHVMGLDKDGADENLMLVDLETWRT